VSSNQADNATLTRQRAQLIVLVALVVALGVGWYERREISAADIPLEALPEQVGPWTVASEEISMSTDNEYKLLARGYQSAEGKKVHVRIQATYTRLGSLRDWSLASMAEGWSVEEQALRQSRDGAMEARIQRLVKGAERRTALTWYTSAKSQSPSLKRAQLKGWRDRLVGGKKPWASLYLVSAASSDAAEEGVTELAEGLCSALRELMATGHAARQ